VSEDLAALVRAFADEELTRAAPRPVRGCSRPCYDQQAGRLRCSLASAGPDGLPFGGRFCPVAEPGPVLAVMAADKNPGMVVWEDLADVSEGPGDTEVEYSFPVFATQVAPS
jgi:hypothetical protein